MSLPPGVKDFEFDPPHDDRSIVRVVVTYGIGCREGAPLSRAGCERFETVYSPSFVILKAPEP